MYICIYIYVYEIMISNTSNLYLSNMSVSLNNDIDKVVNRNQLTRSVAELIWLSSI